MCQHGAPEGRGQRTARRRAGVRQQLQAREQAARGAPVHGARPPPTGGALYRRGSWPTPLFAITGSANRTARQTTQNRHREWLHRPEQSALRARARRELRGLRLGCWCDQPGPCHGHNLCEVADADIDDDADGAAL